MLADFWSHVGGEVVDSLIWWFSPILVMLVLVAIGGVAMAVQGAWRRLTGRQNQGGEERGSR